jgi:WD40 repeat protein
MLCTEGELANSFILPLSFLTKPILNTCFGGIVKKSILVITVCLSIILSACSSPAPTTEAPVLTEAAQPTATVPPTEPPTPTEVPPTSTPEPTATPEPEPQPITADNVSGIALSSVVEIPRQPNLIFEADPGRNEYYGSSGIVGGYTPDSQHLIFRSDAGVDVLAAQTLEVEKHYPGLYLANILADGRFAAVQSSQLVFVDPVSGEMETVETDASFSGLYAVNPSGEQAAVLVDDNIVRLYSLTGGEPLDIDLGQSDPPQKLSFTGDGGTLILVILGGGNSRFEAYETATATKLYDYPTYNPPQFSTDGKYFSVTTFNGVVVVDTATNDVLNTYNPGHIIERGCDLAANICVDHGVNLWGNFVIGSPETAIVITKEVRSEGKPGNSIAEQAWHEVSSVDSTFIANMVTGEARFVFGGYSLESLRTGFGAPDGSTFVIIQNNGKLGLHSLTNGEKVAESDRFAVGSAPKLSADGNLVGWSNLNGVYAYDWQNAELTLEAAQPLPVSKSTFLGFLPEGRLLVESVPAAGTGVDVWDIASGSIASTLAGLADCSADSAGAYVLCTVPSSGARRIIAVDDPDNIVFTTNDPTITVLSPAGDSYATCNIDAGSITYKNYESGNVTIAQPCQPMAYSPDGTLLVLQSGMVVGLPSGESTLTLEADASGKAFDGESPAVFFGTDLIILGNRVFDSASGELLVELPVSNALGFMLSEDGLTLNVLTGSGLEQWQVTQ